MTLFVDASAIVAIIAGEDGADILAKRLDGFDRRLTSAVARWEAVVALHRSHDYSWDYAHISVDDFLEQCGITTLSIEAPQGQMALSVYGNYGKGRHKAGLNMGDCFAYACADLAGARLLYKGEDFAKTDLAWNDSWLKR